MAAGDAYVFLGFLTPVLTQIYFQSHGRLFTHASAEVRGEKNPGKKFRLNQVSNSQPPSHESDTLTTELPGRGIFKMTRRITKATVTIVVLVEVVVVVV